MKGKNIKEIFVLISKTSGDVIKVHKSIGYLSAWLRGANPDNYEVIPIKVDEVDKISAKHCVSKEAYKKYKNLQTWKTLKNGQ
jgi:ribosomal protein S8